MTQSLLHYAAEIQGRAPGKDSVTFYDIRVSCGAQAWEVQHRYNDFCTLHDTLARQQVQLAELPGKSNFRIRCSPCFQNSRQEGLNQFLQTALSADPALLRLDALRFFLQVPEVVSSPQAVPSPAQLAPAAPQQPGYAEPPPAIPSYAEAAPALQPGPAQPGYAQAALAMQTGYGEPGCAEAALAMQPGYAEAAPALQPEALHPGYAQAAPAMQPGLAQPGYVHVQEAAAMQPGCAEPGYAQSAPAMQPGHSGSAGESGSDRAYGDRSGPFGREEVIEDVRTDRFGDTEVREEVVDRDMFGNVEDVREKVVDRDMFGNVEDVREVSNAEPENACVAAAMQPGDAEPSYVQAAPAMQPGLRRAGIRTGSARHVARQPLLRP